VSQLRGRVGIGVERPDRAEHARGDPHPAPAGAHPRPGPCVVRTALRVQRRARPAVVRVAAGPLAGAVPRARGWRGAAARASTGARAAGRAWTVERGSPGLERVPPTPCARRRHRHRGGRRGARGDPDELVRHARLGSHPAGGVGPGVAGGAAGHGGRGLGRRGAVPRRAAGLLGGHEGLPPRAEAGAGVGVGADPARPRPGPRPPRGGCRAAGAQPGRRPWLLAERGAAGARPGAALAGRAGVDRDAAPLPLPGAAPPCGRAGPLLLASRP